MHLIIELAIGAIDPEGVSFLVNHVVAPDPLVIPLQYYGGVQMGCWDCERSETLIYTRGRQEQLFMYPSLKTCVAQELRLSTHS